MAKQEEKINHIKKLIENYKIEINDSKFTDTNYEKVKKCVGLLMNDYVKKCKGQKQFISAGEMNNHRYGQHILIIMQQKKQVPVEACQTYLAKINSKCFDLDNYKLLKKLLK